MNETAHAEIRPPFVSGAALSRPQKAAVVVRLLLAEGVRLPLTDLPDEMQDELVLQMARMRLVDQRTLSAVAEKFAAEIEDVGLAFPQTISDALGALGSAISSRAGDRFRRRLGSAALGDSWGRIAALPTGELLALVSDESPEIAAVVLSKLAVAKAAELLGQMPGPKARRIAHAVSRTEAVSPATVQRIGAALMDKVCARSESVFDAPPSRRVGEILNSSVASVRDDVLESLDEVDHPFATEVRKVIFTFANLAERIDPQDVPVIVREIEPGMLVTAMRAASQIGLSESVDFILKNLSQRMAAQVQDEMELLREVRERDGETAMAGVLTQIRALVEANRLSLLVPGE